MQAPSAEVGTWPRLHLLESIHEPLVAVSHELSQTGAAPASSDKWKLPRPTTAPSNMSRSASERRERAHLRVADRNRLFPSRGLAPEYRRSRGTNASPGRVHCGIRWGRPKRTNFG